MTENHGFPIEDFGNNKGEATPCIRHP